MKWLIKIFFKKEEPPTRTTKLARGLNDAMNSQRNRCKSLAWGWSALHCPRTVVPRTQQMVLGTQWLTRSVLNYARINYARTVGRVRTIGTVSTVRTVYTVSFVGGHHRRHWSKMDSKLDSKSLIDASPLATAFIATASIHHLCFRTWICTGEH